MTVLVKGNPDPHLIGFEIHFGVDETSLVLMIKQLFIL